MQGVGSREARTRAQRMVRLSADLEKLVRLGARPVHQIITMIKWTRTSRLSILKSLSLCRSRATGKTGCETSPPNHLDDKTDSDQELVNKEPSLCRRGATGKTGRGEGDTPRGCCWTGAGK